MESLPFNLTYHQRTQDFDQDNVPMTGKPPRRGFRSVTTKLIVSFITGDGHRDLDLVVTKLQGELTSALTKRSIPPEQRRELAARIQRKLILTERQLKSGALKAEKTEAKGLDYSGKVRIIEQSLSSGGFLEVIERTVDGSPQRRLVEPSSLRKEGNELILVGQELPNRVAVELSVSKLGLVRRLRATLFKREPTD